MRTPLSERYISIVQKFDQLMGRLDALWINGLISEEQCIADGKSWSRYLNEFVGNVARMRWNTRQILEADRQSQEGANITASTDSSDHQSGEKTTQKNRNFEIAAHRRRSEPFCHQPGPNFCTLVLRNFSLLFPRTHHAPQTPARTDHHVFFSCPAAPRTT